MRVNEMEVEFDYYLSLAKLFDEGYPSLPHLHETSEASLISPEPQIASEPCDPNPEEHAVSDVSSRVKSK